MAGVKRAFVALALAWAACCTPAARADTAPAMLLAEVYAAHVDVTQYWVSEKFDGVRAQWDGHALRFAAAVSSQHQRGSRPIFLTCRWTANCGSPAIGSTRCPERCASSNPSIAEWRQVRYLVFELPGAAGDFSARVRQMQTVVAQVGVPWLQVVEQTRVTDRAELMRRLDAVVRQRGEGLMLHRADAPYLTGRSDVLLKLKPWLDTEAVVVGYVPGKGKYEGMTGALQMEMPNGKRFRIGSGLSDALRRQPPPIGARVTYRYQHLTKNGMPRFPRYVRVREDF